MMDVYSYEKPASVMMLLMFIISGWSKLFSKQSRTFDMSRLQKLGFTSPFVFVVIAGIFELASCGVILYDVFLDKTTKGRLSSRSKIAAISLIIFTTLVTMMFYVFPIKLRPLLGNLSTLSGLLFLYQIIIRNMIQNESYIPNETIRRVEQMIKQKKSFGPG